jgi:hypothetical protein
MKKPLGSFPGAFCLQLDDLDVRPLFDSDANVGVTTVLEHIRVSLGDMCSWLTSVVYHESLASIPIHLDLIRLVVVSPFSPLNTSCILPPVVEPLSGLDQTSLA